jgi:uncharacterized membrane protein YeiB
MSDAAASSPPAAGARPSPASGPRPARFTGVDVARALAFGGMLLAHFAGPVRPGDPGWLQAVDRIADGRAAPLFCIVLGMGAGLLAARGTSNGTFLRRSLVLLVLGLAVWPQARAILLILPHYAVLLAFVPLIRLLPRRALLPLAAALFVAPSAVVAALGDRTLRSEAVAVSYADLTDVLDVVDKLFWTGGYPLVGWAGFFLVGIWLAGLDLGARRIRLGLLGAGTAVALLQPLLSAAFDAAGADKWSGLGAFLDGRAHSNRTAWYVLGAATAVAVVGLGLVIGASSRDRWAFPLVALGQLALTAYLAHLAVGRAVVWPWRGSAHPSLARQMAVVGLVFAGFAVAAALWRLLFRRGPVEAVVRWASDGPWLPRRFRRRDRPAGPVSHPVPTGHAREVVGHAGGLLDPLHHGGEVVLGVVVAPVGAGAPGDVGPPVVRDDVAGEQVVAPQRRLPVGRVVGQDQERAEPA